MNYFELAKDLTYVFAARLVLERDLVCHGMDTKTVVYTNQQNDETQKEPDGN